jgi:NAD(P)-dependent dehydrogenase (short-subunit alcohol dehydrogenase family)
MSPLNVERDRVAVVSGAGTGIGQAIATKFAALGWRVAIGGRRVERLEETATLIQQAGGAPFAHPLDVRDPDSVEGFFAEAERHLGPATVVINNAATARYGLLEHFSPQEIDAEISTKLTGSLYMARRGILSMRREHTGGDILFITSPSGVRPWLYHLPYAAASAAVEHAARILRLELEGSGIRVTVMRCGETKGTEFANTEHGTERMTTASQMWFRRGLQRHVGLMTPDMAAATVTTAVTLPMTYQYELLELSPSAPGEELPTTYEEWTASMIRHHLAAP